MLVGRVQVQGRRSGPVRGSGRPRPAACARSPATAPRRARRAAPCRARRRAGRTGRAGRRTRRSPVPGRGRRRAGRPRAGRRAAAAAGPAGDISLCTMPWPAVMMFSSPGRTIAWVPRLSRCSTSPSSSQLTVCSPVCGMRPDLHPGAVAEVLRAVVVEEAPGADHPDLPVRQRPHHLGRLAQRHPPAR